jgi:hypothetical protein
MRTSYIILRLSIRRFLEASLRRYGVNCYMLITTRHPTPNCQYSSSSVLVLANQKHSQLVAFRKKDTPGTEESEDALRRDTVVQLLWHPCMWWR